MIKITGLYCYEFESGDETFHIKEAELHSLEAMLDARQIYWVEADGPDLDLIKDIMGGVPFSGRKTRWYGDMASTILFSWLDVSRPIA